MNLELDNTNTNTERPGHRCVRYIDDSNLYVGIKRARLRVMESVTHFITHRLKLKVNQAKSAVARPGQRKFLGFSFTSERKPRRRIRSEEHTSELQSLTNLVCRLLLEKKKKKRQNNKNTST